MATPPSNTCLPGEKTVGVRGGDGREGSRLGKSRKEEQEEEGEGKGRKQFRRGSG